jgi:hypothetical protein
MSLTIPATWNSEDKSPWLGDFGPADTESEAGLFLAPIPSREV